MYSCWWLLNYYRLACYLPWLLYFQNPKMQVYFLAVLVTCLSFIHSSRGAQKCHECSVRLEPGCDNETCKYDCPLKDCLCRGLCHTTVRLNRELGHLVESTCAPQVTGTIEWTVFLNLAVAITALKVVSLMKGLSRVYSPCYKFLF